MYNHTCVPPRTVHVSARLHGSELERDLTTVGLRVLSSDTPLDVDVVCATGFGVVWIQENEVLDEDEVGLRARFDRVSKYTHPSVVMVRTPTVEQEFVRIQDIASIGFRLPVYAVPASIDAARFIQV